MQRLVQEYRGHCNQNTLGLPFFVDSTDSLLFAGKNNFILRLIYDLCQSTGVLANHMRMRVSCSLRLLFKCEHCLLLRFLCQKMTRINSKNYGEYCSFELFLFSGRRLTHSGMEHTEWRNNSHHSVPRTRGLTDQFDSSHLLW
jgi:hypothetical protein